MAMIGSYSSDGAALPNLWTSYYVDSYNYIDGTNTTYDGGAYKGLFAAVDTNGVMDGRFIGLYLDPYGKTGYLKGALTGNNYQEISMFYMSGGVSATQMASGALLNPADFVNNNIWRDSGYFTMDGSFGGAGGVGDKQNWNGYMDTLAIADYENKPASEHWGVYMLNTYGEYSNPDNSSTWSAKLGGRGGFGAYNLNTYYAGNYGYADGGWYAYNYNTNLNSLCGDGCSNAASIAYYRPGAANYYTDYHVDGTTYTYDYNTGLSTYGTWDAFAPLSYVAVAPDSAYSGSDPQKYTYGNGDYGYWIADIKNGSWAADGKVTGDLSGRFITDTKLGTITGDAIGAYNPDGTYQLASLGTWSGTPLTFMSRIWSSGYSTDMYNYASYTYTDGGSYSYNNTGNYHGYVEYYRPGGANYYTGYYSDGTTYTYDYSTGVSIYGTWDMTQTLASILGTPVDSSNASPSSSKSHADYFSNVWTDAIMGGTGDLWHASAATPASVTMIGDYYRDAAAAPVLFSDYFYSYNAVNNSYTTYDKGAYYGFLAGTGLNNNLNMSLIALYIDPYGNAGILRGSLAGTAYPDADVFEMDGGMYPTQVAANIGTTAADLSWSIWRDYGYGMTAGSFNGAGSMLSDSSSRRKGYLDTMSIVAWNTNLAQGWGIYSYADFGSFTNPNDGAQTWSAKLGGDGGFGAYNPGGGFSGTHYNYGYWIADVTNGQWANNGISGKLNGRYITQRYLGAISGDIAGTYDNGTWQYASLGTWENTAPLSHVADVYAYSQTTARHADAYYTYADGGHYSSYFDTAGFKASSGTVGVVGYYRPGGAYYYAYYYSDGTTYTYDSITGLGTNGTWDKTQPVDALALLLTPLDQANVSSSWSNDYAYQQNNDYMHAYLGGVDSLWGAANTSPAAITAIGRYYSYYNSSAPGVFSQNLNSYNYANYTGTTYDGGAYAGYLIGSTSSSRAMSARLVALYIDPNGNAGVIKGTLGGAAYPDIQAFAMDGSAYPTQMALAADIGIAPENLTRSISYGWDYLNSAGSFNGSGSITGGAAVDHMSIGNASWGIYKANDYGLYSAANPVSGANFSLTGGTGCYGCGGYTIVHTTGTFNADETITGTQTGRILSLYDLTVIDGDTLGAYSPFDGTWQAVTAGTWTTTPLAWSGDVYDNTNYASLYSFDSANGWLDTQGGGYGFMGDTTSLWTGTGFTMMGSYYVYYSSSAPYIWTPEIKNFGGVTTFAGAYQGFISGVWKDEAINAKVYSLYIDPAGNAGILTGTVTGGYYPQLNMFDADGTWSQTALATGLDVSTASVNIVTSDYGYSMISAGSINGSGAITAAGNEMLSVTNWRYSLTGQDWGIWKSLVGGTYTGPASDIACVTAGSCDTWSLDTVVDQSWQGTFSSTQTNGTKWSDGVLAGQTTGFGADIRTTPQTWITVGETVGTFDPASATFAAVNSGVYMDIRKVLDLAATTNGQALLTSLKIPAVEVGRTNLGGSWTNGTDSMTANMNNVVFLAPVTGAAPAIWGSNAVNGGYAGNPSAANVAMSNAAANINASFAVKAWDTTRNTWTSAINGAANAGALSGYGGAVNFKGAGAGAIDPATGTFSGTAAGIAK
ncbi:MAG: hypothetical protein HZB82_05395 [Deltaproteobacteria bacterium]|nr:hypothetical protein [Deltaproteobacteria bacterium]